MGQTSNRDAIGARLRLTAGSRTLVRDVTSGVSYQGQSDLRVHFGLGDRTRADALEVRWPNGGVQKIAGMAAHQIVTIREGDGVVASQPFTR